MLTETLTPQKLPVLQDMEELFQLVSVKNRCIQQLPIEHASLLFLTCEHLEVKSSWKNLHLPVCMGAKTPQSTALCILSNGTLLPLITIQEEIGSYNIQVARGQFSVQHPISKDGGRGGERKEHYYHILLS